jgi:YHS domain-containing protein
MSRFATLVSALALVAFAAAGTAQASPLVNVDSHGLILDGYDAVAFFTDHHPVKGDAKFQSMHEGAKYYFASAEHKAVFDAAPSKYAPQFGAFCAYAVSRGRTAPISVDTFSIVDGRLLLQHNAKAVRLWNEAVPQNLARADKYWPRVEANSGKQIDLDPGDGKD